MLDALRCKNSLASKSRCVKQESPLRLSQVPLSSCNCKGFPLKKLTESQALDRMATDNAVLPRCDFEPAAVRHDVRTRSIHHFDGYFPSCSLEASRSHPLTQSQRKTTQFEEDLTLRLIWMLQLPVNGPLNCLERLPSDV